MRVAIKNQPELCKQKYPEPCATQQPGFASKTRRKHGRQLRSHKGRSPVTHGAMSLLIGSLV